MCLTCKNEGYHPKEPSTQPKHETRKHYRSRERKVRTRHIRSLLLLSEDNNGSLLLLLLLHLRKICWLRIVTVGNTKLLWICSLGVVVRVGCIPILRLLFAGIGWWIHRVHPAAPHRIHSQCLLKNDCAVYFNSVAISYGNWREDINKSDISCSKMNVTILNFKYFSEPE